MQQRIRVNITRPLISTHDGFENTSREILEPTFFPCSVAQCFASARGRVWCPASARGRGSPSLRETLLVQIPREALLHKSRSVVKFDLGFESKTVVALILSSLWNVSFPNRRKGKGREEKRKGGAGG